MQTFVDETQEATSAPEIDLQAGKRELMKSLGATAIGAAVFGAAMGDFSAANAQSITDADILNFALNLEYLEASYYLYAVTGQGLSASDLGANPGQITGGRQVPFQSSIVRAYGAEIAADERSHVEFLRSALGSAAVSSPSLNIGTAFTTLAQVAGLPLTNGMFNPYANDTNFLLGAFVFEDVGVTAYNGAAALIQNPAYLTAAAQIYATEGYHVGIIRTTLFALQQQQIANDTQAIAQTRSALANSGNPNVDDYGIGTTSSPHMVLGNQYSQANARTTRQVLNIVYGAANGSSGLFFPNGMNGTIR